MLLRFFPRAEWERGGSSTCSSREGKEPLLVPNLDRKEKKARTVCGVHQKREREKGEGGHSSTSI